MEQVIDPGDPVVLKKPTRERDEGERGVVLEIGTTVALVEFESGGLLNARTDVIELDQLGIVESAKRSS